MGCASWGNQNKEKAVLYLEMANTQIENNNLALALKDLLTAEELDPSNPVIQNNLGLVYFLRERYQLSEKHFSKAVSLSPQFTDARNNHARVLIELGRFPEAEKQLNIVLNDLTYVALEKGYVNMGLLRFNQKRYADAITNFQKALKGQPDNCAANTMIGRSYFEEKDYMAAAESLDRAIEFCQKQLEDEPHYFSALTYYRLGNREKALARFRELLNYYPNGVYRERARGMIDLIRKGH